MARTIDITEKLGLCGKPQIVIGKTTVKVDDSARTMMRVLSEVGDGQDVTPDKLMTVYELLFDEADRGKLDKLGLSFADFTVLIEEAMGLVTGGDDEGEAVTPATA